MTRITCFIIFHRRKHIVHHSSTKIQAFSCIFQLQEGPKWSLGHLRPSGWSRKLPPGARGPLKVGMAFFVHGLFWLGTCACQELQQRIGKHQKVRFKPQTGKGEETRESQTIDQKDATGDNCGSYEQNLHLFRNRTLYTCEWRATAPENWLTGLHSQKCGRWTWGVSCPLYGLTWASWSSCNQHQLEIVTFNM